LEKLMHASRTLSVKLGVCAAVVLMYGIALASDSVTNVAGTWTVTASSGRRKATQTLVIQQDGTRISGTFKGPRQSGTLEGSVNGTTINFHVTAKTPLDYTGTVESDTMKGTLSGEGRDGNWTASKAK
jgi:hypothetical protein